MASSVKDLHRVKGRKVWVQRLKGSNQLRRGNSHGQKERAEMGREQRQFIVRKTTGKEEGNEQERVTCGGICHKDETKKK